MIIAHATLPILPDKREEFLGAVTGLIETSNAEEGVIDYQLYESVATPNTFLMVEHYTDAAAFDAHMSSEHLGAAAQHLGGWASAPPRIVRHEAQEGEEVPIG